MHPYEMYPIGPGTIVTVNENDLVYENNSPITRTDYTRYSSGTIQIKLDEYQKEQLKKSLNAEYGTGYFDVRNYNENSPSQVFNRVQDYLAKEMEKAMFYDIFYPRVWIKKVIFNDPATIVIWSDGTKTVVKKQSKDYKRKFDPEKGLAMAISKKFLGNEGNYYNEISKWVDTYEKPKKDKKDKKASK